MKNIREFFKVGFVKNRFRNKCAIVNNTSHFSLKRPAFTLAEVLITLGIIGVVAAMTMPSLVANYEKKRTATAVKKA